MINPGFFMTGGPFGMSSNNPSSIFANFMQGLGKRQGPASGYNSNNEYSGKNVQKSFEMLNRSMWNDFLKNKPIEDKLKEYDTPSFFDSIRNRAAQYGDNAAEVSQGAALRSLDRADVDDGASLASARHRLGLTGQAAKVDAINRGQIAGLEARDAARDGVGALRESMNQTASQTFLASQKEIADRKNVGKGRKNDMLGGIVGGVTKILGGI